MINFIVVTYLGNDSTSDSESDDLSSSSTEVIQQTPPVRVQYRDKCRIVTNSLEAAINHMFLPKRLPDTCQPELGDVDDWILQYFSNICIETLQFRKFQSVSKMLYSWKSTFPCLSQDKSRFVQLFSHEVANLSVGDTIPVYVRRQNCTILITRIGEDSEDGGDYQIEAFRPCLPSETIMSSVGSLEVSFPETCDTVYNSEMLCSKVFAKQIHDLSSQQFKLSMPTVSKGNHEFTEHRDVADPFLVTDWLVGLLVPSVQEHSTVKITKKIRDEVICKRSAKAVPFRRSGIWTSLKVALHLKLVHTVGNPNDAKIIYKCLILRVLADITKYYEEKHRRGISIDIAGQMLAKLGTRVRKLQKMTCEKESNYVQEIKYLWSSTLKFVHTVASSVQDKMKDIWNESCAAKVADIIEPIQRSKSLLQSDLLHSIPWLNEYIARQSATQPAAKLSPTSPPSTPSKHSKSKPDSVRILQRFTTFEDILLFKFDDNPVQHRIWLYDCEKFVKTQLVQFSSSYFDSPQSCSKLFCKRVLELMLSYVKQAVPHYTSDSNENPVGFSQMLLTVLQIIQVLDLTATTQYPLLSQYKSGINPGIFNKLILPHSQDMRLLDKILDYFRDRDLKAAYPGILDNLMGDLSDNSLATRFAERCDDMLTMHKKLLADMNKSLQDKQELVLKVRGQCMELQGKLEATSCEECAKMQQEEDSTGEEKCSECTQIEVSIEEKRFSVPVYERLLPEGIHMQLAVIFELMIPEEIKTLREALALLKFDLLREQENKTGKTIKSKWAYFKNIQSYRNLSSDEASKMFPHARLKLNLSSQLLPSSSTHHTRIKNPDVLSAEAISSFEDDDWPYLVPNGMDCVYHYASRNYVDTGKLQKLFAFQVASTKVSESYSSLQWAIEGCTHSQNRILSEINVPHHPELVAFGSLRAGHRIQLMNLYRYLSNRQLQLEREPVLALILQTLWEVGPRTDYNAGDREAHVDFLDDEFTEEFVQLLETLVSNNDTNYANPLIFTGIVVITGRIMELNETCRERCYNLLKTCRSCLESWVDTIELEIKCTHTLDEDETLDLQAKLLEISTCLVLSYNLDSRFFQDVLKDGSDLITWLEAVSKLSELSTIAESRLSPFGRFMVKLAKDVPLKLSLETRLMSSVELKDLFVKSLHLFSLQKWDLSLAVAGSWKLMEDKPLSNIVVGRYQADMLTFDLLQGTFLVNGYTRTEIPEVIRHNPMYEMYFRRPVKVVQDGVPVNKLVLFRTSDKFHGKHYEFQVNVVTRRLRIWEIQEDNSKLELMEPEKFRGILGDDLVYGYSHWLELSNQTVHFRRLPVNEGDYSLPPEFQLKTHDKTNMWLLQDKIHGSLLFNRASQGFDILGGALSRLEDEKRMNIAMALAEDGEGLVTVKLPRYHLNFNLINGHLHSVEYKGFKVAYNQSQRGTLIGLQHGLLLDNIGENIKTSGGNVIKRILIVPHGHLSVISSKEEHHQRVKVDLANLRQPPFFSYELDPVLKRLKADRSKCAWLYLASLHAATSTGVPSLPDPFTELTGTEMAAQILQSACVWSCSPYDSESLHCLKMIRKLSPRRVYYGHDLTTPKEGKAWVEIPEERWEQMEATEWPTGLPSMAAFDGYAILVDRLIRDSHQLEILYEKTASHGEIAIMNRFKSSEKLLLRAYYRHLSSYNKATEIRSIFLKEGMGKVFGKFNDPELILRKVPCSEEESEGISKKNGSFDLKTLLGISQVRLLRTLGDPMNESRRKSDLFKFLFETAEGQEAPKKEILYPAYPLPDIRNGVPLSDLLGTKFKQHWLKFYSMAVNWVGTDEKRKAFSVVLSTLAYQGAPLQQLINLHNVSVLAESINFPALPESVRNCLFSDYSTGFEFCEEKVRKTLKDDWARRKGTYKYAKDEKENDSESETKEIREETEEKEEKEEIDTKIDIVISELKQIWPCDKLSWKKLDELCEKTENFWNHYDLKPVNLLLTGWFRNSLLKTFVETVESFLDKFYDHFPKVPGHNKNFKSFEEAKLEVNLVFPSYAPGHFENFSGLVIEGDLDEPGVIFYSGSGFEETHVEGMIPTQREQCLEKIDKYLDRIRSASATTSSKKVISLSGLSPRLNPIYLLQCLLHGLNSKPGEFNPGLLRLLGALAVLWTELKRFNRIMVLLQTKDKSLSELKSELENPGHENWSPVEYPEWLILELELDIMIRPIQVSVAHQMISMPDGGNGVMQLNMGEGKTSVVVPMLCVTLSKDKNSLCRITVLSSLFKTNVNLLTFTLGGAVLSRRVYTFPCRRDMKFDVETLDKMLKCYQECLKMKSVVVTLPEYRLSFRLLAFDKALRAYPEVGVKFMEIENGLRNYCRDILDESDELLNVKYQLVYTIGSQVNLDGGELRWTTCQKLLQIVQDIGWVFLTKLGTSAVEFLKEDQASHPEQFTYFRLLDETAFEEFLSLVADELLKDYKLTDRQKQVTKRFLTQEKISQENFKFVLSLFKNDSELLDEIRLLSGYFRRGILCTALSKRWRVDYGVGNQNYRRMAVPFRAKDFAAERTEFGHPDLAIILTHLSYYYSGLSDLQLEQVFDCLKEKPEAESLYGSWIGRFSNGAEVPKYLATYQGINLQDAYQRSHLCVLLRKHKDVVDFWLANYVFPEECKQFPGKISMTGWDLCYEKTRLPTTGFSGTNDSSLLLPLPISQQDLEELQDTNKKMESTLLLEENQGHKGLPMGVTCKNILEELKKDHLKVLIDSGALMLECDNEQVAELWLEVDPDIEAAVYFSKDGELLVKCRRDYDEIDKLAKKGKRKGGKNHYKQADVPLELSPYRDRLEHCGVFLDDQHTRGTDLKFPAGIRACVTIGTRMRRDKLMQACMRMRQLGNGHKVCFYLSHEATSKIPQEKVDNGESDEPTYAITTKAILNWVIQNSQDHNDEGLVYWALAGKNYAQKLAAQEFHDSVDTHALEKIFCLARQCVDDEILTLKDMYGSYTETELLTTLIPEWFEKTQRKLLSIEGCYSLSQQIMQRYDNLRDSIVERCMENIPTKTCLKEGLASVEEEQEKEIEVEKEAEVEEERENVNELSLDWVEPSGLHENVKQAILQGQKLTVKSGIARLSEIFAQTSFSKLVQPEGWANAEVFVTSDFISVVKPAEDNTSYFKTDSHLRPIEYIVSVRPQLPKPEKSRKSGQPLQSALQILVISPFEVNELIPYFRDGKAKAHLHMFSARHFQNQDLLVNKIPMQMPRKMTVQLIPDTSKCIAALLAASGNLYFASVGEQQMYARFLALVPRPWTPEQMNAFEKEFIKKTGFLLPKHRRQEMDSCQIEQAAFQKDPIPLIKKILLCRHAVISDVSHVSRLLNRNWFVDIN